jgi:hypothetical protein
MKFNVHPSSVVLASVGGAAFGSVCTLLLARHIYRRQLDAEIQSVKDHYNDRLKNLLESSGESSVDDEASVGDGGELELDSGDVAKLVYAVEDRIDGQRPRGKGQTTWAGIVKKTTEELNESAGTVPERSVAVPVVRDAEVRTNYRGSFESKPDLSALAARVSEGSVNASDLTYEAPNDPAVREFHTDIRDTTKPYVITDEEFAEDHNDDYQKLTITYFAEDDVLVDDKEVPITDRGKTVGPDISEKFGQMTSDPHLVHVRNDRLEIDFEIVLDNRAYTEVVLGYGNPEPKSRKKIRAEVE